MNSKTETITPARARKLLANNANENRNVRDSYVIKLARAIERGEWMVTHQGIALDGEGRLLDGQHRLLAIVMAQTSVRMVVTYDLDAQAYAVIDTGRARTAGDLLRGEGYGDPNNTAAAVRCVIAYHEVAPKQVWNSRNAYGQTTTERVMAWLLENDSVINALPLAARITRELGRHGLRSGLTASLAIIEMHAPSTWDKLGRDFVEAMATGANLGAHSPILAWRRAMINYAGTTTMKSRRVPPQVNIAMTLNAWSGWITGTERRVMSFRLGSQPMPRVAALADLDPGEDLYRARVSAEMQPLDDPERHDHPEADAPQGIVEAS